MRSDEGKLRAYLDDALSADERQTVETWLADEPEAAATLHRLRQERDDFAQHLTSLAPPPTAHPNASQALKRLQSEATNSSDNSFAFGTGIKERMNPMFNQPFFKKYQPAITAIAVAALVAVLFSFAPVRAVAGNFLQIFRVQEIKVIPVDVDDFENMENKAEIEGLLEQFNPEANIISGGDDPQDVGSLAEAADLVDFSVVEIGDLPGDVAGKSNKISVQGRTVARLDLDKELMEALFEAAEIEISLPDSLNESPIIVTMPNAVHQVWGETESDRPHGWNTPTLSFIQMKSPEVEYPDDLDLNALGAAGMQLIGMSKAEATALSATIDWANTLVLPIPQDDDVNVDEVNINGASGYVFEDKDYDRTNASVMWAKDGVTYFVAGTYTPDEILDIARSVK